MLQEMRLHKLIVNGYDLLQDGLSSRTWLWSLWLKNRNIMKKLLLELHCKYSRQYSYMSISSVSI